MTTTTSPAVTAKRPRRSILDRPTLMSLAATEYDQFALMLSRLDAVEWTRATECPGWDVRAMASHVLGMAEMAASIREGLRQQMAAKKRGGIFIDALTALQVEQRTDLTPDDVTRRFEVVGPRAAKARKRVPGLVRNRKLPMPQLVGDAMEDWTIGFLVDTILTRDTWMHRVDISRAVGRPLEISAGHDGVLVADVVAEWAGRHGKPCELTLTGAAGGRWSFGAGGPTVELDAIELARTVSGREPTTEVLNTLVPF
jgi:uncharacterized protein (TIGR03083 family)